MDEQLLLEHLRKAVAAGEIWPALQPQVDLRTRRITGFEVLARWTSPVLGPVPPVRFIPVAEQAGLLDELVLHLIRQACAQVSAWPGDFHLAFNLAPTQFLDLDIVDRVSAAAHAGGLALQRLCIEITESSLFHSNTTAQRAIALFKQAGMRLALDDFGTGHSSLTRLQALPFDEMKIDASFVHALETDPNSLKIVTAVLGLGHSLGVHVVAEGIENERQAAILARMGCELGQGYLWGAPQAAPQAQQALARQGAFSRRDRPLDTSPFQRFHQLESLYQAAPVGLGFIDAQLRLVSANARIGEMLGLDVAQAMGRAVDQLLDDRHLADFAQLLQRVLQGEPLEAIEYRRTDTGTTSLVALQQVRSVSDQPLGVSVFAIDISGRVAAERTLHETIEHYRQVIALAPNVAWAAGPDGSIDYMGQTWEWSPMSTSAERHARWRERMDEADQLRVRAEWLAHLPSRQPFETVFRILWPDGTWKWVRSRARPQLDAHGEVTRWYGLITDITAEHALALRVQELERRPADAG
ncbi:EAL domain-containing protein [Pseudorhodoferax sp. Leaf274]|uniref:sensor domain-containing phosphodiesterase n=1 Tax=Pseudorhodoferax sp. Leaf274 TaxID=1736318 RepID=UPI000702A57B|nr:EAL domain-containing protein [Pseudorhodoferax sp. Leaf274]KQP43306.1 diguanylate cyclase [Pseudorhodoferax sp. Leaf274]